MYHLSAQGDDERITIYIIIFIIVEVFKCAVWQARRRGPMLVSSSALLYVCRDRSTIRDGEPRTTTSTFTQLLTSDQWLVQCCFTSKEAVSTIRDRGGGGGVQDGQLDFHTAP